MLIARDEARSVVALAGVAVAFAAQSPAFAEMRHIMQADPSPPSKLQELMVFLTLSVFIWPFLAMTFVGTYGFAFWIYFLTAGPPGPG